MWCLQPLDNLSPGKVYIRQLGERKWGWEKKEDIEQIDAYRVGIIDIGYTI